MANLARDECARFVLVERTRGELEQEDEAADAEHDALLAQLASRRPRDQQADRRAVRSQHE